MTLTLLAIASILSIAIAYCGINQGDRFFARIGITERIVIPFIFRRLISGAS